MKKLLFELQIIEQTEDLFLMAIIHENEKSQIQFSWPTRELKFLHDDKITAILKENEYQLRKILHNKRPETFYVGFKLKFIIRENKDVESFNKLSNIIVLDKRNGEIDSYAIESSELTIPEIYTDGCYLEKYKTGAYASLIKFNEKKIRLYTQGSKAQSSSLLELKAAILALEIMQDYSEMRIITDSRYVIKGLTEWLINWKLNNWHTAQGNKVKNIEVWQYFDRLSENKYIEFKWVKAHSKQPENTLCDFYAKEAALRYFVEN
jgi:ribonuclease HI